MGDTLTKSEWRHIMIMLNAYGEPGCELCSSIRKKVQDQIAAMPEEFFSSE